MLRTNLVPRNPVLKTVPKKFTTKFETKKEDCES
jgi:hypothetical protein